MREITDQELDVWATDCLKYRSWGDPLAPIAAGILRLLHDKMRLTQRG